MKYLHSIITSLERRCDDDDVIELKTFYYFMMLQM